MSSRRPRLRTWRRTVDALARPGRARAASPALREDHSPLEVRRRPQQGRLGDWWVMAPMLAVFESAPERLEALFEPREDGLVRIRLPGARRGVVLDRRLPVDARGRFLYARQAGAAPGWAGMLEKAIAVQVAGGYRFLRRGFGRYGLMLLLGTRVRTTLWLPSPLRVAAWLRDRRVVVASTHPFSGRVRTSAGPLAPRHVYAVVGADPERGLLRLRDPVRPDDLLSLEARSFRRAFLSVDVSGPLT